MAEVIKYSPTQEARQQTLPTIRAIDLVNRAWDPEREKLGLQRSPMEIQITTKPDQTTEYLATLGSHLRRDDFFNFLKLVAPNKESNFDIRGILGDWDLPDRAVTDTYGYERELAQRHKGLGEAWDIFEQSRKVFMQDLTFSWDYLSRITRYYWTKEMAEGRLRGFLVYPQRDARLHSLFRLEHYQRFLNPIQQPKMGREKKMGEIKANLIRYGSLKGKTRQEMVGKYLESLTEEEKSQMLTAYSRADGRFLLKKGVPVEYGPFDIQEGDGRVEIRNGDFTAYAVINKEASHGNGLLAIDEYSIDNDCSITPALHWTKDKEGHREYIFDFPVDRKDKSMKTKNPLAGLLSIAYFCPDIVDGWPKYMALPDEKEAKVDRTGVQTQTVTEAETISKEKRKQFMGPAQVPVLAIMFRRSLLNSDFIQAVENFAQQNSQ